jgi:hypothetical protein
MGIEFAKTNEQCQNECVSRTGGLTAAKER